MLGERTETGGTSQRRTYLNIKDGTIVKRTHGEEEFFSFVEGRVEDIFLKEREFRGEAVMYWYLDLRDQEEGELFSLGFPYGSNVFKSIILQIASEEGLKAVGEGSPVKIEPYFSNGYDKVKVTTGETRLNWVTKDLPPVGEIHVGERTIKDDTKRMELINNLVDRIKDSLPKRTKIGKQVN